MALTNILSAAQTDAPEYPLESTAFHVFSCRWGITKLPLPYLVSPTADKIYPLFDTAFNPQRISGDGVLVDSVWSEADKLPVGEPEPPATPDDSAVVIEPPLAEPSVGYMPGDDGEASPGSVSAEVDESAAALEEPAVNDMFPNEPL